jgi:uncharacterized membrane protein
MQLVQKRKYENKLRILLWSAVIILIITLFVSAFLRVNHLVGFYHTGLMPPAETIEYGYARNPLLTFLHILPGTLFIVLGALQFLKPLRNRFIHIHRWMGRTYLLLGLIVGISAIVMGFVVRFGGITETTAVTLFGIFFLFSLGKAYLHIRRKEFAQHREWMIRAYSIGIAVATMRPVIGLFFAFTNIPFHEFFGITFWIAFILHTMVAEMWILYTRQ